VSRPAVFISSIVTPADSYSLVDLADVKTMLGVTVSTFDNFFSLVIPQASTAAQNYANNPFVVETIQDQWFPGSDGWPWTVRGAYAPLQLKRWPLVAVPSVVETIAGVATTLTLGTDFLADMRLGQLTRLNTYCAPPAGVPPLPCDWRPDPVVVQYQAGWETLPGDVFAAVVHLVKLEYYSQTRDPLIRSQSSPGIYEASYVMGTGPGGPGDLDAYAASKLDRYRVPVIA
jgi:hypothetical protein